MNDVAIAFCNIIIMVFKMMRSLILAAFLFFSVMGCSSGPDMKEGMWEISTEVGMKGIPLKLPSAVYQQCLSKRNLIPRDGQNSSQVCQVDEQATDGDSVSWKMVCQENNAEIISEGMITYHGVLFSGQVETTFKGGPVSMNATSTVTGKYLGPCQ
mgnify:CR=1 FL=1